MPGQFMYCAFPTRLEHLRQEVKARARAMGYGPLVPFDCVDFCDSEGNPRFGRDKTLQLDLGIMRSCDVVGVFGVSCGVMGEVKVALDHGMTVHIFPGLDPEWETYYEQLKPKYGDLFQRIRGQHHLVALVGPSAIGKTYWSNRLLQRYPLRLRRVKNTTTRQPRDAADHDSYNFVSRQEFEQGIADFQFLEHDEYLGSYYGSSLADIRQALKSHSGIFAITPAGAQALSVYRYEINVTTILFQATSTAVLDKNMSRRGVTDPRQRHQVMSAAEHFILPPEVPHHVVEVTGNHADVEPKILEILDPIINPH